MGEETQHKIKYQQLLRDLKTTVEGLLVSQVANVWCIYGGLNRLHVDIEKIFKHGCKTSCENSVSGYWQFVQGLELLHPDSSKSTLTVDCEYKPYVPQHLKSDKASIWLYKCIENHSLSQKLSWLLSDKTHLFGCYRPYAFLCQEKYAEATLICLRAVERNQPSLISEIDPCLFLNKSSVCNYHKVHKRCSSFPDAHFKATHIPDFTKSKSIYSFDEKFGNRSLKSNKNQSNDEIPQGRLRVWNSMSNLRLGATKDDRQLVVRCHTNPSTPFRGLRKASSSIARIDQTVLQYVDRKSKVTGTDSELPKTKEIKHVVINNENIIEHTATLCGVQRRRGINDDFAIKSLPNMTSPTKNTLLPRSAPDYSFLHAMAGEKDFKNQPRKTFIEDGGKSVLPMATGYFPRPTKDQTLTSFLTSSQFAGANAELDRENAHFSISEAMISAMEQIRCKRDLKLADEQGEESDEEINNLKQRIRLRRREKLEEKQKKGWGGSVYSDKTETTTTEASSCSTSPGTNSVSPSSEDVDDMEIDETSNLSENCGLSMSMASLYSEADLLKRPRGAPDGASDILSAEGVALSLISRFSERQLPRASELEWLVSEEDAPQALLPLPKSWPVSPDDSEAIPVTPLRGTWEWAPPRPQIIFTLHLSPSRKALMAKQNYRCAGCGMKVAAQYANKFRYCHYLGRYFCTGCHTNQVALIPARVIQKWDFTSYPVSTFSYRLLEQMYTDPLFRIFELNRNITKRSKNLFVCRKYRFGLYYMKDFILSCRFSETIQDCLQSEQSYMLSDPDIYSLQDLVSIRTGEMKSRLQYLVEMCCRHIHECELCLARGFMCEICNSTEVIFPWQQRRVSRCAKCGSCFHSSCWTNKQPCVRCFRIDKRKETRGNE